MIKLIVRRPQTETREVLDEGRLDPAHGLVGDNWQARGSNSTPDKSANPEMQLNLMNARVIELLSPDQACWALAGDQLFVDFDLSESNVPPGTHLALVPRLSKSPLHPTLAARSFPPAMGSMRCSLSPDSPTGRDLHLRGINAKVVQPGVIRVGDLVSKI